MSLFRSISSPHRCSVLRKFRQEKSYAKRTSGLGWLLEAPLRSLLYSPYGARRHGGRLHLNYPPCQTLRRAPMR